MAEHISAATHFLKWLIISMDVLIFFGIYFAVKYFHQIKRIDLFIEWEKDAIFWAGVLLFVAAVLQYIPDSWITLSLGAGGVALIFVGMLDRNKTERWGGLAIVGLTLGRVILVDLSGLEVIFKIITFISLGILCLAISFVYNRFNVEQKK